MPDDFGVVVTCCSGDYILAKGCCASVRYFMGDVPLCLLIDGEFPLDGLPELYGAKTIKKENVRDPFLRNRSYGWGITKLISCWESPFEHFLLLDADTIVFGDVRKFATYDNYDVILNDHGIWAEDLISRWFFNVERIKTFFPNFAPMSNRYANSGVMFVKRGLFTIKEYQEMLDFVRAHPDVFFPGEQGFLNFMLFRAQEEGRIRVGNAFIQYLVSDHEIEEAKAKYDITNGTPVMNNDPTVLHWCGSKPLLRANIPAYTEPMTFFRKQFLSDTGIKSEKEILRKLLQEEKKMETLRAINSLKAHLKKPLKSVLSTLRDFRTQSSQSKNQ